MGDDEATPVPGMPDVEMRRVTFPDGKTAVIGVKAGLSQAEADLIAAQVWAEIPEPGAPGS